MDTVQFSRTWLPLASRFYQVAFYILEDAAGAEDAVQDLYIRLWSGRDKLENILRPEAYGVTVLKHICLDRIRHAAVIGPAAPLEGLAIADPEPPPDQGLSDRETLQRLKQRITQLPESQRKVLQMRIFEGLSYDEIAARTGLSGLHLRVLLSKARKTLKNQWEK